jgi:hypothetical protein
MMMWSCSVLASPGIPICAAIELLVVTIAMEDNERGRGMFRRNTENPPDRGWRSVILGSFSSRQEGRNPFAGIISRPASRYETQASTRLQAGIAGRYM